MMIKDAPSAAVPALPFFFQTPHAINAFTNAYGHSDALVGKLKFSAKRIVGPPG